MSKIVIDARELRTSTGRYIERLLHYLPEIDSTNDYVVLLKPQDIAGWRTKNEHWQVVACPHKEFTFAEQLAFKRQLDQLKPDLVHFGKDHQPILYRGRCVTTMHDLTTARFRNPAKPWLVFKFKQLVYKQVIRIVAKKSKQILTPSAFVKNDMVAFTHVDPDKITVTPEAADPILASPAALPGLQNQQFIMYVGRPTPHKNLERLIEAFARLRASHPALHLVLAGKRDANYSRIGAMVAARGITNVIFTDFVSEGELRWLYEHCAAYVFPSLSEGFGLPGLEAMQHGAPVVSSNATCLPEIYGNAAHYFDPLNVQAMADAINEVVTDQELRARLIAAGTVRVATYSWRRLAEQTLVVYQKALRG
jgi:glycosyltransferase involved in cell wall biosynthesis